MYDLAIPLLNMFILGSVLAIAGIEYMRMKDRQR